MPSLVDRNVATISADRPVKLIDGPNAESESNPNLVYVNTLLQNSEQDDEQQHRNAIFLGHHQLPKTRDDLTLSTFPSLNKKPSHNRGLVAVDEFNVMNIKTQDSNAQNDIIIIRHGHEDRSIGIAGGDDITGENQKANATMSTRKVLANVYTTSQTWLNAQESKILKLLLIISIGMIVTMFWFVRGTVRDLRQSRNGSQTISRGSGSYQEHIDLNDGEVKVGKITFNSNQVLGKGCDGTVVFKGMFEKRHVAVKRLLPHCFTLAEREVSLLCESDAHENVVRYFCTERDRHFKYIAVELCATTLQDYIEGGFDGEMRSKISVREILKQTTSGLLHLHVLHIGELIE